MKKQINMPKNKKIDFDAIDVSSINNENMLRKKILIPLLQEIGAENVQDLHGSNEWGIDIYFEHFDIFSHRRRFGVQAKTLDINFTSTPDKDRNILVICNQIEMAFSKSIPLPNSKSGKIEVSIDGYYVITTKKVIQTAAEFILKKRSKYPYLNIIDGNELQRILENRKILQKKYVLVPQNPLRLIEGIDNE